jgi:predicted lipid carrier protein YhbT
MADTAFPATLATGAMRLLPPPLLGAGAALLLRRMGRVHPALFRDLAALPPTTLRIAPADLPHRFLLHIGGGPPRLRIDRDGDTPADSCVKGRLEALVALLEGRLDSDTAFFSRAITVTGDTAAVVGLRNTLERDGLEVMAEATALLGPLAGPARRTARRLETVSLRIRAALAEAHAALHRMPPAAPAAEAAELTGLRNEVRRLASRLARLEGKRRHEREEPAA